MTDHHIPADKLHKARHWSKRIVNDPMMGGKTLAAAEVIQSLPDEWIDAEKLREVLVRWEPELMPSETAPWMAAQLRELLPAPRPRPEDVKPKPQPGEAWLIEFDGKRYEAIYWYSPLYAHWSFVYNQEGLSTIESHEATPVSRLVPEQAPVSAHPVRLVTEDDYRGAPNGTVVWGQGPSSGMDSALEKYGNAWIESGDDGTFTPRDMERNGPHEALRWGDAS